VAEASGAMWVLGYGSLIWDGWQSSLGCRREVVAELAGFRRTFNKGSVKNWGSAENPCPTLNLAADPLKTCKGVAFEFPEEKRQEVIAYLTKREGKGVELPLMEVRLDRGERVYAIVPLCTGKHLLSGRSPNDLVAMASSARGEKGKCIDYVRNIVTRLAELGIDDPNINEFWRALNSSPRMSALGRGCVKTLRSRGTRRVEFVRFVAAESATE